MSSTKLRNAKKEKAIEYLGGCCWKCEGVFHRDVYDIHHIVPSTKTYEWDKLKKRKWATIKKELDICVLLCSNCHRLAHKEMREHAIL
tara:strand:- start:316 stop:579 length:264 start_codon:yes stop_codon:yes gene_type:complete